MLCARSLRPVTAIARAGPLSLAGGGRHRSLRATALSDQVKPGTYMLGGKGALATRGQRITLLLPANAAAAGDEDGGGKSGPPAPEPERFLSPGQWAFVGNAVVALLFGLLPFILTDGSSGEYIVAGVYLAWVVFCIVYVFR